MPWSRIRASTPGDSLFPSLQYHQWRESGTHVFIPRIDVQHFVSTKCGDPGPNSRRIERTDTTDSFQVGFVVISPEKQMGTLIVYFQRYPCRTLSSIHHGQSH